INAGVNPFAPPPAEVAADDSSGGGGRRGGGGSGRSSGDPGAPAGATASMNNQGRGGFANLSDDVRKKMTDLRQKMQGASPEEREALQKQITDLLAKAGISMG